LQYTSDVRIRGKSFSNWWLLLVIPLLAVSGPLLLSLLFVGNDLAGVILGPPAIWDRPWHSPPGQDLVGRYSESERLWDETSPYAKAQLELRSDGTMIVNDLPSEFGEQTCTLTGIGTWEGPDTRRTLNLIFIPARDSSGICPADTYSGFELAGHTKPYSLYWILGDPDSGTGVWFARN
jgi:hypothetical protein